MSTPVRDYTHPELDIEITAIGGHYVITKEACLPYQGEEVLYAVGNGIADRTCCGFGGICYANVAGYIRKWKYRKNDDQQPVSQVEPVTDTRERDRIRQLIKQHETMVSQVNFMPA